MSTQTTNLGLVKPDGPDRALVAVINENMNKIDQYAGEVNDSLGAVEDGMAIVADGNTHVAITSGQFVYVRNHSTLTQGLYTATANIAANATLSTSNLTADPSGGLNALNSKITNPQTYNAQKTSADYPIGIFPFVIPSGTTIGSVTVTANSRGFAYNDSANNALHFYVVSATSTVEYCGGFVAGSWYIEQLALNSNIVPTAGTNVTIEDISCSISGGVGALAGTLKTNAEISAGSILLSNIGNSSVTNYAIVQIYDNTSGSIIPCYINNDHTLRTKNVISSNHSLRLNFAYKA